MDLAVWPHTKQFHLPGREGWRTILDLIRYSPSKHPGLVGLAWLVLIGHVGVNSIPSLAVVSTQVAIITDARLHVFTLYVVSHIC